MSWDQYEIGQLFTWQFSFSDDDMVLFEKISGDHNPIHTDVNFALAKGYTSPLVYGLLLGSQISRLVGQELPDKNAILTGLSLDFFKPAYVGEKFVFEGVIDSKSESTNSLSFRCRITKNGQCLCKGRATAVWKE